MYNSDKSDKLVLDSKENYLKVMREHFINDSVITLEDVRKTEKLLNNHARSWVRIFNIGDSIGQMKRCTRALMSNYVMIPSLQGLHKNDKPNWRGSNIGSEDETTLCCQSSSECSIQ